MENCYKKPSIIKFIAAFAIITLLAATFGCTNGGVLIERSAVVINEVVSANKESHIDEQFGSPDWVEFYNRGSVAVDLSGCGFSDNILQPQKFIFPEGTIIEAGEYITIYCIAGATDIPAGMLVAGFGLSKSGETLLLTDKYTEVVQKLDLPMLESDVAYARADDGSYGYTAKPTYGKANTDIVDSLDEAIVAIEPLDELRFTEIVNGRYGWVELYNISNDTIMLSEYCLSDDPAATEKWRFPDTPLGAGEYIVVELAGVDEDDTLNASFKVSSAENAIYLFNNLLQLTDSMEFDPNLPAGVSAVATETGVMYTTHITKGEPNSDMTFPAIAWTEMDANDPIRLNEALQSNKYSIIDSEGDRSEWVELWNSSSTPISLLGYYISDNRDDATKWALPDVTLEAGEYAIIFLSGKDSIGDELHASFRLSRQDEGVFLFNYDGMRMDSLLIPSDLNDNVSVGRDANGEIRYYASPTPNAPNTSYGFTSPIGVGGFNSNSVYISEVSGVAAPRTGELDWIEFYNGSEGAIRLEGWYITDDPDEPHKFELSRLELPAGGYGVLYCTTETDEATQATAPFGLSGSGETLYLVNSGGEFCDVFETGVTGVGVTSGREQDSQTGERVFFATATKGRANASPLSGYASEPVFSHTQLYCAQAFTLELTCATADAIIYYTLDGSIPTSSSNVYTSPISITQNTSIRAIAYRDGLVKSPAVTHTYLFEQEHTVPVFCISLSQSDFNRMYVASQSETGGITKGPEVSCHMEYYEDGLLGVSGGAGVRLSGASTTLYAQKSLGLYFRAGYGRSEVTFPFFEGCDITTFRSVVLRNAGQDATAARIRDAYMSRVCQGLNIDVSYVRPVVVYINGSYWGLYDLKENMNEDYLASHYGVDRNAVDVIKRNRQTLAGSSDEWNRIRNYCVSYNFANESNYEQLAQWVDVYSIMDYLTARTYFYDGDMFNQKYWRSQDYSMKWRAVFYDSDYAMHGSSLTANLLSSYFNPNGVPSAHGSITNMDIYCALNQNPGWRDEFIVRYIYIAKYYFEPTRALALYDELVSEIEPEITRHIERWNSLLRSYSAWENQISSLRNCIAGRQSYALRYLRLNYGLSEAAFAEYELRADELYASERPAG